MTSKIKLTAFAMLAATALGSASPLLSVSADSNSQQKNNIQSHPSSLSEDDKNKIDPFIQVQNNQYVLSASAETIGISHSTYTSAQNVIKQSNAAITSSGNEIATSNTDDDFFSASLFRSSTYSIRSFWWGTRYYFTSNAAVYQLQHELQSAAWAVGMGGAASAYFSVGIGAFVGGMSAGYYSKIASDLGYYNSLHPHDYIYMDWGISSYYKMGWY